MPRTESVDRFGSVLLLLLAVCAWASQATVTPPPPSTVRRNVKDYGAVGDGIHDDSLAFISALTDGKATTVDPNATHWYDNQYNCQTTKPTIVHVPSGIYRISQMLPLTYYTQLVGNHSARPTLQCVGSLYHCLDAGIDEGPGNGWYGGANQDNFFHQVRNLVLDLTGCQHCVGIHWQVSQATNLVNLQLLLGDPAAQNNTGILMEDGSGGYFGGVSIDGGNIAMALGNQQFTVRNVSIANAATGIFLYWNWVWSFHDIRIRNVSVVGIYLTAGVASLSIVDSVIEHAPVGILCMNATQLLLDRVDTSVGVAKPLVLNETIVVANASDVYNFAYARRLDGSFASGPATFAPRPTLLLDNSGNWFARARPNYDSYATANFTNWTDVTDELQALLNECVASTPQQPLFIPYGTYFISQTVVIPTGSRVFGEVWTRFAAVGAYFQNASDPHAMFQVGQPNDVGTAELADLLFTTRGPAPGAKLLVWHTSGGVAMPGASGIWDVHFRIGGAVGTEVNGTNCNVNVTMATAPECIGVHTLFHIAPNASVYVENVWGWVADHDIDLGPSLNIYNARGMVVETDQAVWLYGTAMEHSYLFQYNLYASRTTLLSIIQTETAYMQPEFALHPSTEGDPQFSPTQRHGYSIVAREVTDTILYGAGMYSFFFRWKNNACGADPAYCQTHISTWTTLGSAASGGGGGGNIGRRQGIYDSSVRLHNYNTHAATNILEWNLVDVPAVSAPNGFCDTVGQW